jgi:thiol:disulfide interchange protein DsbA
MKPSRAASVLLASLLLAACQQSPPPAADNAAAPAAEAAPAATAAPAAAPAPIEPAPAPVAGEEAPSKSEASLERLAELAPQDQLPSGKWKAGTHYKPLVPAQPTNSAAGKVEVVEVFWYGCGHCYTLDPFLETWNKNKAAYVEFTRVPVIWGPAHRLHAKLFYTLQALGREGDLHVKVFDTIHRTGNGLVGNDEAATYKVQLAWAEANGINEADFKKAYDSFGVATALQRAETLTRRYQVDAVPLMVINGKYTSDVASAGGHSQMLAMLNDLAAAEKRR